MMALPTLLELIIWIFLVFWAFWYVYIQLERLNPSVFEKLQNAVLQRLEVSSGALRIIGLIIYSPYVMPVRAAITWLVVVLVVFYLKM